MKFSGVMALELTQIYLLKGAPEPQIRIDVLGYLTP